MGLADALGSSSYVAREIIKAETIVDFTPRPNYFEQLANRFGASVATKLAEIMNLNNMGLR